MTGVSEDQDSPEEMLERLLRRAHEPFASIVEDVGFASAVRIYVRAARRVVDRSPTTAGAVAMQGIRDQGALWLVGEDAERLRSEAARSAQFTATTLAAMVAARVFGAIAYRHPFYDGNKRTALLAAAYVGVNLGLRLRDRPVEGLDSAVVALTAREAPDEEVASWLLDNVFIR